jgi:2-keto-4-pentenoate hydratase/2-oxohepta-3-ene-1,7-dioic acid hydratase in catechol pathway
MYFGRIAVDSGDGPEARIIVAAGPDGPWVDLRLAERRRMIGAGAAAETARRISRVTVPSSMSAAIATGDMLLEAATTALEDPEAALVPDPSFILPLDPSGYRDCMIFDGHFSYPYRTTGRPVPKVLYELPVGYQGNPKAFVGPEEPAPWPSYSKWLDYELELGIVIGREGSNLTPDEARDRIFGFTILNDLSARDTQFKEMEGRLGPCKGKHFACSAGPVIATADSLPWEAGLRMVARINGEKVCDASSAEAIWGLDELVAWVSQEEQIEPGWLIGSGTCNGGSTVEIERKLEPGDEIEFEIEGLGRLRNRLGEPAAPSWAPDPRPMSQAGAQPDFTTD